jgi:hypothetical protein
MNGGRINATIGGNTAGAGALVSSGTMTLVGGNNVTLSQNGNAITISGGAGGGGSQTLGISNLGNTAGISGMASGSALQYAFAGGNNVTLSQSINGASGTMTISAANQTVQTQNLHNMSLAGNTSGAMAQISSGTLTLAGGNNITLSQNGNAVTISAGAGGGGGGVAIANSQTTFASGTANFVASGALTIASATAGQSFNLSVPQTSSLSATGAISIFTNGSTISIGAPIVPDASTLSRWEYPDGGFASLGSVPQGSLSVQRMYVPFNVSGSAMKIGGSLNVMTNTSATTASVNISLWMGIYTLNGSTLSLASSGSANNGFRWSQSASTTANTLIVPGMRQMTVPVDVNMKPGEYWVGAVMSTAFTYTSMSAFTVFGNTLLPTGAGAAVLTPIGSSTAAANRDVVMFQGIYTAGTSAGPISMSGGHINNTAASNVLRANFYNVIYNATY